MNYSAARSACGSNRFVPCATRSAGAVHATAKTSRKHDAAPAVRARTQHHPLDATWPTVSRSAPKARNTGPAAGTARAPDQSPQLTRASSCRPSSFSPCHSLMLQVQARLLELESMIFRDIHTIVRLRQVASSLRQRRASVHPGIVVQTLATALWGSGLSKSLTGEEEGVVMGYARYVGRVGALAVALGIGVAVTTGQGMGMARADDSPPADPPSAPSDPSRDTPPAGPSGDLNTPTPPSDTPTPPSTSGEPPSAPNHTPSVPDMNFDSSGGAHTSGDDDDASSSGRDKKTPPTPESETVPAVTEAVATAAQVATETPVAPPKSPKKKDNSTPAAQGRPPTATAEFSHTLLAAGASDTAKPAKSTTTLTVVGEPAKVRVARAANGGPRRHDRVTGDSHGQHDGGICGRCIATVDRVARCRRCRDRCAGDGVGAVRTAWPGRNVRQSCAAGGYGLVLAPREPAHPRHRDRPMSRRKRRRW